MHSEFYENRSLTALMMKGESELAARASFERKGWHFSTWESCRLCVRNRSKLNVSRQRVSQQLILGDGSLTDDGVRGDYWVRSNLGHSAWLQHECWLFPAIRPKVSRNVTAAVRILFEPHNLFQHFAANAPGAASETGDRP